MARTRQQSKARSNGQPRGQQYGRRLVRDDGPRRRHGRADCRADCRVGGELPGVAALATGPGEDVLIKHARAAVAPAADVLAV
ncbi:hypothetical protein [Saccharothrix sp. ST-888]|uniref:hypothetical protein n=1 Tax=Saccharothrix sp. ST-888 TaxID=1427391 RepID=UPI0012E0B729|nr:hypothetical protein [Saccharothrix sp. ST-888]